MHLEHYRLFERNGRREIQELVFSQTELIKTPRLHSNNLFRNIFTYRIDELIEQLLNLNLNDISDNTSYAHSLIKELKLNRKHSIMTTKDEGSVPLSETLNVIHHANDVVARRFTRIPTIMTVKENEESSSSTSFEQK